LIVSSLALRGKSSEFKPAKKAHLAVVNGSWGFKLYIYIRMSLQRTFDSDDRIVFYEFFVFDMYDDYDLYKYQG